jgi:hypothetical protein
VDPHGRSRTPSAVQPIRSRPYDRRCNKLNRSSHHARHAATTFGHTTALSPARPISLSSLTSSRRKRQILGTKQSRRWTITLARRSRMASTIAARAFSSELQTDLRWTLSAVGPRPLTPFFSTWVPTDLDSGPLSKSAFPRLHRAPIGSFLAAYLP